MSMTETMLLAVGLPVLLLMLGLIALAVSNEKSEEQSPTSDVPFPVKNTTPKQSVFTPPPPDIAAPRKHVPANDTAVETDLTRKLTVWTGGASLALAGYFLIQYAIKHSMLTPEVRVGIGSLFGLALIVVAEILRARKKGVEDGSQTAPSLAGAGVACLYATLYGAGNLYQLLQPAHAFLVMALVTMGAVALSLRHGMPVAIIGMMGGYLMPVIVKAPFIHAGPLFGYLFLLTSGLFAVARRRGWEGFAVAALAFAYGWALCWQVTPPFNPDEAKWIGLYILALAAIAAVQPEGQGVRNALHYFSAGSAFPLMALTLIRGGYQTISWQLAAILVLASFFAARRTEEYNWMPWVGAAFTVILLMTWPAYAAVPAIYAAVVFAAMAMFTLGSIWLQGSRPAILWAVLLPMSAFTFFAIAWMRLGHQLHKILGMAEEKWVWSGVAALTALILAAATAWLRNRAGTDKELHDRALGLTASTAAIFAVAALVIDTPEKYVTLGLAVEILIACWIVSLTGMRALRVVAGVLAAGFVFAFLRQAYVITAVKMRGSSALIPDAWEGLVPMVATPFLVLGAPLLLLLLSAGFALKRGDGRLVVLLESIFVALLPPLAYYGLRGNFVAGEDILFVPATFLESGLVTNLFYLLALVVLAAGRKFGREAFILGGTAFFFLALFRTVCLDLFARNPFFSGQAVEGPLVFNPLLLLAYAVPVLWLVAVKSPRLKVEALGEPARGFLSLTLLVAFATLTVRHYFHHPVLKGGVATNAEIYAYSAAWLGLGALLLGVGIVRADKPLRQAAFGVIALTVLKVFLYDVSALDDLYRVFAFLGLGLSLFVLNWIYGRFVAKKR